MQVDPIALMRMPFGKYRGTPVVELPTDYVCWLYTADLTEPLKSAVDYVRRMRLAVPLPSVSETTFDLDVWYRKLAIEFHPDRRGGNNEGMKAVQRAKELAQQMMGSPQ